MTMANLANFNPSWFLLAMLASGGVAAFMAVLVVVPAARRHVNLVGYRASARRDGLKESGMLRLIWPLVELGAQHASKLGVQEWRVAATNLLVEAGSPLGLDVDEFFGLIFASCVSCCGVAFVVATAKDWGAGIYMLALGLGIWMPLTWVGEQGKERFKSINRGLPQALDLIVMAMGAGLDFTGSLKSVVERWTDKKDPMYHELSRFLHELGLGKTRREALEDLAVRAPTQVVRTFVANVIQAEQRGTPLIDILAIQADVARTRRFQTAEKIAGRAGVLVLLPLMLIFAATILVLFGGLIVKNYRGTLTS